MLFKKREFTRRQYKNSEYSYASSGRLLQWINGYLRRVYEADEDKRKILEITDKYDSPIEFFDVIDKCCRADFYNQCEGIKVVVCNGNLSYRRDSMVCDRCGFCHRSKKILRKKRPYVKRGIHVKGKEWKTKEYRKKYNDKYMKLEDVKKRVNLSCKEYYQRNKEKVKKRVNEYKKNNPDKLKKYDKMYYQKNKERLKKYAKSRYHDNKMRASSKNEK